VIDIRTWLNKSRQKLSLSNPIDFDDNHSLIAEVILAFVLGKNRVWVKTYPEHCLADEQVALADHYLNRASLGEPLAYILKKQEFFGLEFLVTPDVLIPRPETELIVEAGLDYINRVNHKILALDIGTGSGCIAISICKHSSNPNFVATDISFNALRIAQINCENHHLTDRVFLVQADLFPPTKTKFNLICANLPYIPTDELASLKVNRYEPNLALNGGQNGIEIIQKMLSQINDYLDDQFSILIEIQYNQDKLLTPLVQRYLPHTDIKVIPDYQGLPRLIRIES